MGTRIIRLPRTGPEPFTVREVPSDQRYSTVRSADSPVRPHGREAQPGR